MTWLFHPLHFWAIMARLSGMVLMIPAFEQVPFPLMVRIAAVFWLTTSLAAAVPEGSYAGLNDIWLLTSATLLEFLFGLTLGYCVRVIFSIFEIGGTILDTDMGYRTAEQFNPGSIIAGGPISRLTVLISVAYFWLLDYFQLLILALRETFLLIPPLTLSAPFFTADYFIKITASIFASSLAVAAPVLAIMFAISIGVGFLARSLPGMSFLFEIYALRILTGMGCIIFFLPLLLLLIRDQMLSIIPHINSYLRSIGV